MTRHSEEVEGSKNWFELIRYAKIVLTILLFAISHALFAVFFN